MQDTKQSTLVTDDLRSILKGVCLFVVTLQKYPDFADLKTGFSEHYVQCQYQQEMYCPLEANVLK